MNRGTWDQEPPRRPMLLPWPKQASATSGFQSEIDVSGPWLRSVVSHGNRRSMKSVAVTKSTGGVRT